MNISSYDTQDPISIVNKINNAVKLLKILSEENRIQILNTLLRSERCVTEIQGLTKLSQSLVSHHLYDLKRSGLVRSERSGKWVYYSLTDHGASILQLIILL